MADSKLTHDQRMLALRMYGEGYRFADIQRQLKIDFGISLHHESIRSTCDAKVNQPFIEKFRASYLSRISDVPIANKRIRIDDLEKVRGRILKAIEKNPLAGPVPGTEGQVSLKSYVAPEYPVRYPPNPLFKKEGGINIPEVSSEFRNFEIRCNLFEKWIPAFAGMTPLQGST